MTAELVWSLADTHCVWCGKPVATDADDERHSEAWEDQDKDCDRTTCWCTSYCWRNLGSCDTGDFFETERLAELRGLVEAQASVIARVNDGWDYVRPAGAAQDQRGVFFRIQDGAGNIVMTIDDTRVPQEPMTGAEQFVVYGAVVRTEEAP